MCFPLDLSKYYNHIIYKKDSIEDNSDLNKKSIYGLPHFKNIHIIDKKIGNKNIFNIDFKFSSENNIFDNLMCDGQKIYIDKKNVNNIAFLGFSEMGTVCDEVMINTIDKSVLSVPLVLKTFHSDNFKGIDDGEKNSECKLAFYMNGDDEQKHGVFFWKVELLKNCDINSIELPVNCSMHLFAITLT